MEDTRAPWGIAQYDDGERRVAWTGLARGDRAGDGRRDPDARRARASAPGRGSSGAASLSEAAHFWPLLIGTMLSGGQFSLADATASRRVARRDVPPAPPVPGRDGRERGGARRARRARPRLPHDVFGDVAVIGARPGAYERLAAAGLAPHWFVLCGPAVAIATEPGGPARRRRERVDARGRRRRPHPRDEHPTPRARPSTGPRPRSAASWSTRPASCRRPGGSRVTRTDPEGPRRDRRGRRDAVLPAGPVAAADADGARRSRRSSPRVDDAGLTVDDLDGFALYSVRLLTRSLLAQVLGIPEVRFTAVLTGGGGGIGRLGRPGRGRGRDRHGRRASCR